MSPAGSRKNSPIANAIAKITVPTQVPPPISWSSPSSSGGIWAFAEMLSALKPILSDSTSATTPRTTGRRAQRCSLAKDVSGEGHDVDLALGALLGVELPGLQLLGRGQAHGHRPGGHAAHHHSLEHGLTADGKVAGRLELAVGGAHILHRSRALPVFRAIAGRRLCGSCRRSLPSRTLSAGSTMALTETVQQRPVHEHPARLARRQRADRRGVHRVAVHPERDRRGRGGRAAAVHHVDRVAHRGARAPAADPRHAEVRQRPALPAWGGELARAAEHARRPRHTSGTAPRRGRPRPRRAPAPAGGTANRAHSGTGLAPDAQSRRLHAAEGAAAHALVKR